MANWIEGSISRRTVVKALGLAPFTQKPIETLLQENGRIVTSVFTYHEVQARIMTADILRLMRQGVTPLSLDVFAAALKGEIDLPRNMATFIVSCDDGLVSQYTEGLKAVEEVKRQADIFVPLVFFIMPRFDGYQLPVEDLPDDAVLFNDRVHRYMTKGQVIELIQRGHFVQSHTIDHRPLPTLVEGSLHDNVVYAEDRIDALWELARRERRTRAFAYPYGAYDLRVADYLKGQGYDVAFTTVGATQHNPSNRLMLGRLART